MKLDCIPDVIKGLSDFSAQPGECSSCRQSVKRGLRLYDHLKVSPKYYGILNLIRNKIVWQTDVSFEFYNTSFNWDQIRCLILQMTTLVQGSNSIQGFYQEVYHHQSFILDKISCMDMGPEVTNIMMQMLKNKGLDSNLSTTSTYPLS